MGSLILMIAITVANMKKRVLLHKLVVAEVRRPGRIGWMGGPHIVPADAALSSPWPSGMARSFSAVPRPMVGVSPSRPSASRFPSPFTT